MAKELNEDTTLKLSIKTLGGIAILIFTLVGMWFTLQADIAEAKTLPEPLPAEITRMEYDMKDQLIRQTIMTTQEDVKEVKEDIKRIEEKIDISKNAKIGPKHKIVVVPTLVIFKDGEEAARFQANIMMQLETTKKEVQEKIDEILMEDF